MALLDAVICDAGPKAAPPANAYWPSSDRLPTISTPIFPPYQTPTLPPPSSSRVMAETGNPLAFQSFPRALPFFLTLQQIMDNKSYII